MINFTSKRVSIQNKLENLKEFISNYSSAIIAYSGGIDSSLVAQLTNSVLGRENTLVVIAVSPSLNNKEFKLATNLAKIKNWNFKPIFTQEFNNDNYNLHSTLRKLGISSILQKKIRVKYKRSYYKLDNIGRVTVIKLSCNRYFRV